jgi:hypothetical protein
MMKGPFMSEPSSPELAELRAEVAASARTYSVRYGTSTASVTTVNDTAAGDYGNLIVSSMTITEYIP